MSTSVCSKCFPFKGDNRWLPSLHQNYPTSLVLRNHPTSCPAFGFLALLSLVTPYSPNFGKTEQDLPSCCNISMCDVPRSTTPKESLLSCHYESRDIAFCAPEHISLLNSGISELNPFNQLAFGPSPNCLRLKIQVTPYPPRLATSEWLILSRWESHPLYVAT